MLRRDFVRAVISFLFAAKMTRAQQANDPTLPPPAPVPWTLGLNSRTPLPATEPADQIAITELRFFTQQQMATLMRLSDLLLPSLDGKPGALQAQTPIFLDFLIGASPESRQKVYAGGLDWLEQTAQAKYKTAFAHLDDTQAGDLLKPWLRTWMNDHPPAESHADFINIAHDDIRSATINSKAWSEVPSVGAEESTEIALFWSPIEPDPFERAECEQIPPHVQAAPRLAHTMPSYPR
jgi:gluconate 2-dehydrogenase subunit 3-like protein